MTVNVLGTEYTVERIQENQDKRFTECDGYCDETTKRIAIAVREPDKMDKGDLESYYRKCVRHELVHAFLFESGQCENCEWAHNDEVVDWIAAQFPKLTGAMRKADALDDLLFSADQITLDGVELAKNVCKIAYCGGDGNCGGR